MKENIVAVIPARGGSKRIKDKNIKLFKGEPAISNTIKKLKKSKIFSRIIVSTFCFFKKKINMIFKKYYKKRSQDLKQIFCDAGQFYWGSKNSWLKEKMHFSKKIRCCRNIQVEIS